MNVPWFIGFAVGFSAGHGVADRTHEECMKRPRVTSKSVNLKKFFITLPIMIDLTIDCDLEDINTEGEIIQEKTSQARLKRRELVTTETDDSAIAAAAITGFKRMPKNGYSAPAAIGIPTAL